MTIYIKIHAIINLGKIKISSIKVFFKIYRN